MGFIYNHYLVYIYILIIFNHHLLMHPYLLRALKAHLLPLLPASTTHFSAAFTPFSDKVVSPLTVASQVPTAPPHFSSSSSIGD